MGDKFRTIQNLEIIKSDLENNLMFVKGSVPGSKNTIVLIKKNSKKINRITTLEKFKKAQTISTQTIKKTSPAKKIDNKEVKK